MLGAMLLSSDAIAAATETLGSDHFYKQQNARIFEAIESLYSDSQSVDVVTVGDELHRNGLLRQIGGTGHLSSLQLASPSPAHAERYVRIVEETALLRRLIVSANEIVELGYSRPADVTRAIDEAESMIYSVAERRIIQTTAPLKELVAKALDRFADLYNSGTGITGVPTGFDDLDRLLAGLQPSTLNVIGARPSMGKTALALSIAANIAVKANQPVLFFSLEMGHLELTSRLMAAHARVDAQGLQTGRLNSPEWSRIVDSMDVIGKAPMWIDDNPNLNVAEIRAKSRRLASQEGKLGLIVVDYLQLMSGRAGAESRQVEVAEISRHLKVLARELETPVLALSQLSRGLEQRADKRPMLSDLRESGSIEQDADVVMFLYRDEVYNEDSPDHGAAEVHLAKHRNGPTGTVHLAFMPKFTLFANATQLDPPN
ncbi:MAG TPA: replicative DNA helicase [Acidimicrobiaceae bacterium]|nr:replicative DNA helicase [Acidimicrobiaceae bacterium]HCB37836.1 replicative DNA helicase [Acidimicrobiaceae bacterium]